MKSSRLRFALLALVLVAVAFSVAPRADEGFWPYNNVPKAAIKAKYGFTVTDPWLHHLQLATVRFGGSDESAAASYVSADYTELRVRVPRLGTSGPVTVTTSLGEFKSTTSITVDSYRSMNGYKS